MLVFAGAADGIAPVASVKASVPLLTGARDVRFEIVPGGHLGMLTGRGARSTTWLVLDEWIDQWSEPDEPAKPTRRTRARTTAKKPAPTKAAAKKKTATKAPATKAPARKAPAKKTAAQKTTTEPASEAVEIGTNPTRRYGSAGSRALGR